MSVALLDTGIIRLRHGLRRTRLKARRMFADLRNVGGVEGAHRLIDAALERPRFVVALSHSNYLRNIGGTELYLRKEAEMLGLHGLSYVQLSPLVGDERVEVIVDGRPVGYHHPRDVQAALSRRRAAGQGCIAVHLHQLMGWDLNEAASLALHSGAPLTRFFLHDYHSLCESFNLLLGGRTHCAAPPLDSPACAVCRHGRTRAAHMAGYRALWDELERRTKLEYIAPSESAAAVWLRRQPERRARVRVVPHQELIEVDERVPPAAGRPHLGYVGYPSRSKGFDEWLTLSARDDVRDRFELLHFGTAPFRQSSVREVRVNFQVGGPDAMLQAFRDERLDFALLWSLWPETFSFTCYESMAGGAFVLTNAQSGNIAAQVRRTGRGRVFADTAALLNFLNDDREVAEARALIATLPSVRPVWSQVLSAELEAKV